jgi:hypothetical protein
MSNIEHGDYVAHVMKYATTIAWDERIVHCEECKYWSTGMCCTRFGKMEHPGRSAWDFCSRGEHKAKEEQK